MLSGSPTREHPRADRALSCGAVKLEVVPGRLGSHGHPCAAGEGQALLACSVARVKLLRDSYSSSCLVCKQPFTFSWKEAVVMV